jgi:hypothetical protein
MTITIYEITDDFYQGGEAWMAARRGMLTASEMDLCISPANLDATNNDKVRAHVFELAAQRVTGYVEPSYIGDDMLRGIDDEEYAIAHYEKSYRPVRRVGFITNDKWGFKIGYSPDALVGDRGVIEVKSKKQSKQLRVIVEGVLPQEHLIQVQTGLLVSERDECDFISYSGGMPMMTLNVKADYRVQEAIVRAAAAFEEKVREVMGRYRDALATPGGRFIPTERVIEQEMHLS